MSDLSGNPNSGVPSTAYAFRITPRLIVGLGVLAIGLLWTLDNLHLIDADRYLEWWPVILIVAGLARLMDGSSSRFGSAVIVIVGTVLLLDSLDIGNIDVGDLFPLGIAVLGAKLVWDAMNRKRRPSSLTDPGSEVHAFAMMSGIRRQSTTREFHGGDANAIMGGVELDLRNAEIREGEEAVLDVFAMWGGIEIMVPENWRVVGKVLPLMAGFEDKTTHRTGTGPVLIVRGTVLMGSIVVKN
jgi:predicted membrane protein